MENNTLNFKTTINCGSCIKAVTPFLNKVEGLEKWDVDTENPDKILQVQGDGDIESAVIAAVSQAGFDIKKT